jgi:hypothetical protein
VNDEPASQPYRQRQGRLLEALAGLGADDAILTGPAAVAALSGIWIETGEVMPERHPWLLLRADGSVVLLVDEFEAHLAVSRCRLEDVQVTTHRGPAGRLRAARSWIAQGTLRGLAADLSAISAADLTGLGPAGLEAADLSAAARGLGRRKSGPETAQIEQAATALAAAVAGACHDPQAVGAPESVIAGNIAGHVYASGEGWYSVVPIVSSGSNLRIPHARPGGRRIARGDLCRVGVRGRFGPFHVMYVRSAVAGQDCLALAARELAGLAASHRRCMRELRAPDAEAPRADRVTSPDPEDPTLRRVAVPQAQGMGFAFKELPAVSAESPDRLEAGDTVLVTTIMEQTSGDRLYWQQLATAGERDVRLLGDAGEPGHG